MIYDKLTVGNVSLCVHGKMKKHVSIQIVPPVHGLSGEKLQLIVVQAEAGEGEQSGERLRGQVVQGVIAETKPLDVVQPLQEESDCCGIISPNKIRIGEVCVQQLNFSTWKAMLGM